MRKPAPDRRRLTAVSVTKVRSVGGSSVLSLAAAFDAVGWPLGTRVKASVERLPDGVERVVLERFK